MTARQLWRGGAEGGIYYGWVLVVTLGLTETISWGILYYAFAVFLPVMESELGWSRGAMSAAFSIAILLSGIFAAPVGQWLDARGPRLLMTAGSVAGSALMLGWSQVRTIEQFFLLWALLGITMSTVLYEPAFAVVTAWFERQRTRALTAVTLMAGFASTIFLPVESWLIQALGWREALAALAAFLAATTILPHALLLRHRPEDLGLHLDGDPAPPRHQAPASRAPNTSVRFALRDSAFRWLAVAFSLSTLVAFGAHIHLVAYLEDRGYDPGFAALATALVGAMQVFGRIVLGLIGDRAPLRVNAAVSLGLFPVSLLILLLLPGTLGIMIFVVVFGAAKGALTLIRPAYVASLYGRVRFASIAGALAAFVVAANALAPFAAGAGRDLLHSYDPILWGFVVISALATGAALMVRRGPAEG